MLVYECINTMGEYTRYKQYYTPRYKIKDPLNTINTNNINNEALDIQSELIFVNPSDSQSNFSSYVMSHVQFTYV